MPEPEETAKNLRTHLAAQDTAELYAFFLLSLEQKGMEKENAQDFPEAVLRRAEEVLRRFFRVSDTMGYLGENHFGILIPGKMAESVMEEKAAALVHALQAAFQEFPALGLTAFVGVYVFPGQAESFESMLEEAEYALLQARREEKRQYHIYTKPGSRLSGAVSQGGRERPVAGTFICAGLFLGYGLYCGAVCPGADGIFPQRQLGDGASAADPQRLFFCASGAGRLEADEIPAVCGRMRLPGAGGGGLPADAPKGGAALFPAHGGGLGYGGVPGR